MTEHLTSQSFPNGAECNRTEAEARLSMADVIRLGSRSLRSFEVRKGCPSCGADPYPPAKILGRYVMECENDACVATFHVAGDSPADAVAKWNRRA